MHRHLFTRHARLSLGTAAVAVSIFAIASAHAAPRRGERPQAPPEPQLSGKAVIAVASIRDQRISLYDAQGNAVRARISSGQTGYETPVGVYSILQKKEEHYSNLYDDASMPFMQRITWSGVALHAGALPGYPASHGCVRLPHDFAQRIFPMTRMGMRVVLSKGDVAPAEISHQALFKPQPAEEVAVATPTAYEAGTEPGPSESVLRPDVRNWPQRQRQLDALRAIALAKGEEARVATEHAEPFKAALKERQAERAKFNKPLRNAESNKKRAAERLAWAEKSLASAKNDKQRTNAEQAKAKAETALAEAEAKLAPIAADVKVADDALAAATDESNKAEAARAAAVAAFKDAERRTVPVSVFVSLKNQRLYVRQLNEPVFDVPVTIADPDTPIGTHVFTAMEYAASGDDVRWNVVSIGPHALPVGEVADNYDDDDMGYRRSRRSGQRSYAPPKTNVAAASAALDRVTIDAATRERLSAYVWPGSSLIVSDEEASKETGQATDFVVLISGEPQGAIAKRRRQPQDDYFRYYDPYGPYYSYGAEDRRPRKYRQPKFFSWW